MSACENTTSISTHVTEKAISRLTADTSAQLVAVGGQICFVKLTNHTLHASPLTLRFFTKGPSGETDLCSSTFLMKPFTGSELIFKYSVFGANITWRVSVETTFDVDVADVRCAMYC